MLACSRGHKDVVQILLDNSERIELNARTNDGLTAFMEACMDGRKDVVQLLLNHSERIELNARCNNGGTAFIWACYFGQKDIVQLLLDHSDQTIELNARSNMGSTAFMHACSVGHKNVVQLVLDHSKRIHLNTRSAVNSILLRAFKSMFVQPEWSISNLTTSLCPLEQANIHDFLLRTDQFLCQNDPGAI